MRSAVSRVPPLVPSWVSVPVSQQWLLPSPRKASNSAPRPLTSCLPKFTERALRHRAPAGAGASRLSIEQQKARGEKKSPAATRQSPSRVWPLPPPRRPLALPGSLCLTSACAHGGGRLRARSRPPRRDGATTLTPVQHPLLALTLPLLGSATAGERRDRHRASPPALWRCLSQLQGHTETSAGAPRPGAEVKRRELVLGDDAPAGMGFGWAMRRGRRMRAPRGVAVAVPQAPAGSPPGGTNPLLRVLVG